MLRGAIKSFGLMYAL